LAALLGRIWYVVGSDIDDNNSGLEPISLDELGLTNCSNHDVGLLEVIFEVLCSGMTHRDSRIGVSQQIADGASNDVAST
jgi:hypothetical protein